MLLYLDSDETIEITLDVDADNPDPTVFECTLVTAERHARMHALIEARRLAHAETGGRPFDPAAAAKTKETEVQFIASMVKKIRNLPTRKGKIDVEIGEEIAEILFRRIPVLAYDDLLNKLLSAQSVSVLEGKESASRSS